ncbi:MAG: hypothetical protein BIFFINMI_00580 [Phycisphaerae bacterium]|nr:hypothetical protein [Phycisphaerae bacterium]
MPAKRQVEEDGVAMLNALRGSLQALADECLSRGFAALLEADVAGWLFHLLLARPAITAGNLHLQSRVVGVKGFVDVVHGRIDCDSRARPAVRPDLALELKLFPRIGFTVQQHRVHFEHVLHDDLPKLGQVNSTACVCAEVLVDGYGYLEGKYNGMNRLAVVGSTRDTVCPSSHVLVVQLSGDTWGVRHVTAPTGDARSDVLATTTPVIPMTDNPRGLA